MEMKIANLVGNVENRSMIGVVSRLWWSSISRHGRWSGAVRWASGIRDRRAVALPKGESKNKKGMGRRRAA